MSHTLVIGIGNPLRGDDGIGWHIAEELLRIPTSGNVTILTCHQLTPDLAADLAHADMVVFIDASVELDVGVVQFTRIEPAEGTAFSGTHSLHPTVLLQIASSLYQANPEAYLLTIGCTMMDHSEHLSEEASAVVPQVIKEICALLDAEIRTERAVRALPV